MTELATSDAGGTDRGGSDQAVPLLAVSDLTVAFKSSGGWGSRGARRVLRAVDGVTLKVRSGQSVAIVGESGSGKTTLGRTICRLQRYGSGQVLFHGDDVQGLEGAKLRSIPQARSDDLSRSI